ncbi:hypothetical protein N656DRAFT_842216 [Canariomyces notabilis]|uniref:Protein kinase domain-containing protein n=1 Tax=Canariomyces notabilis TaxID=2074819 RepID=A0AAN6TLQ7_9PEZI|nr:hypothetical protein N656DRAFT_842216 [Canariomyces arenarius]
MEVAGLVVGIVGLYSACSTCYKVFTDVKGAGRDADLTAHRLRIQESVLRAWMWHWDVRSDSGLQEAEAAETKLGRYLKKNPHAAHGIAGVLYCVGEILSDRKKLHDDYGLSVELNDESQLPVVLAYTEPTRNLTALKTEMKEKSKAILGRVRDKHRITWALRDGKKFKDLIALLVEYNNSLYQLGPQSVRDELPVNLVATYLRDHPVPDPSRQQNPEASVLEGEQDTEQLGLPRQNPEQFTPFQQNVEEPRLPQETAQHLDPACRENMDEPSEMNPSPIQLAMETLDDFLNLREEITRTRTKGPLTLVQEKELLSIRANELKTHPKAEKTAVYQRLNETVFLERIGYIDFNQKDRQRVRTSIIKLGQLLHLPVFRRHLHALEFLGLVEFPNKMEIGFVYHLPNSLGQPQPSYPVHDLRIREPISMFELLKSWTHSPALGLWFDLARELVRSVAFLHASGWLHKNIRSSTLYLFPKSGPELGRKSEHIDMENPFLIGHIKGDDKTPVKGRITNDIYQHPFKRTYPYSRYCYAFDVYSLGVTLLEIGLWMRVDRVWKKYKGKDRDNNYFQVRRKLIRAAREALPPVCGDLYTQVTVSCLSVERGDSQRAEEAEHQELCARIAAELAQCRV